MREKTSAERAFGKYGHVEPPSQNFNSKTSLNILAGKPKTKVNIRVIQGDVRRSLGFATANDKIFHRSPCWQKS